jgi:hypothetical protein
MALICRYMMQPTTKGDGLDNSYDNMKVEMKTKPAEAAKTVSEKE